MRSIDPDQHCTAGDPDDFSFSHTGRFCGRTQPRRCDCGFCYPDAGAELDVVECHAGSANTAALRDALARALTDHDNPDVPGQIQCALLDVLDTSHDTGYVDVETLVDEADLSDEALRKVISDLVDRHPDDRLIDAILLAL